MAVIRVEKIKGYTVMSNFHLQDANLSLKAKGLLSVILSLPEDWNYSVRGLAKICKEGAGAVNAALNELESAGYMVRNQLRANGGTFGKIEYVIYEQPQTVAAGNSPCIENPHTENPHTEKPYTEKPDTEKPCADFPAQEITNKQNTQEEITNKPSTYSSPYNPPTQKERRDEGKARGALSREERERLKSDLVDRFQPEQLKKERPEQEKDIDCFLEVAYRVACSGKRVQYIGDDEISTEEIKAVLMSFDKELFEGVLEAWKANKAGVKNPRKYMLAMLYNAPLNQYLPKEAENKSAAKVIDLDALRALADRI